LPEKKVITCEKKALFIKSWPENDRDQNGKETIEIEKTEKEKEFQFIFLFGLFFIKLQRVDDFIAQVARQRGDLAVNRGKLERVFSVIADHGNAPLAQSAVGCHFAHLSAHVLQVFLVIEGKGLVVISVYKRLENVAHCAALARAAAIKWLQHFSTEQIGNIALYLVEQRVFALF
jgi:hypothetical protein